jgi:hypothetical protein
MTSLPHHRYLLTRLQREWNVLRARRTVLQRATAWRVAPAPLTSLDELLVLTGLGPAPADPDCDARLAHLVAVARHDDLAARVVLQRMLPGLSACAKRYSRSFDTQLEALDELLSEAWTVIRSFPIERRDRYVIKNLLRDCEYRAFLKPKRRLLVNEPTDPRTFEEAASSVPDSPLDQFRTLVDLLQRARGQGMTDADLSLVTTLLNTSSVKEAAAELNVTDRTVRNRRQAVVRQLRALADVA